MLNIPYAPQPSVTQEEVKFSARFLTSKRVNYWTGEEGRTFELGFAAQRGIDLAIALADGSLAIKLALCGVGVGAVDYLIAAPRTYVAMANSAPLVGARPVFADADPLMQSWSSETIKAALTPKTKAVICVRIGGMPCDMGPITNLARRRGFAVIEDCAQAHGAVQKDRKVGSVGHIGAWSFCHDKIMSTGDESGMVTTNDREAWSITSSLKDHSKNWQADYQARQPPGCRWLHHSVGQNYRMLEMQTVFGRIQLGGPDALARGWMRDRIVAAVVDAGAPRLQGSCSEVYLERVFDLEGWRPANASFSR